MKKIFDLTTKNWKEIIFFLFTWGIGWYLFFLIIEKIKPNDNCVFCLPHWIIFFTAIILLLLPFIKKIQLGKLLKIERDIKETNDELKGFKIDTSAHFNLLSNSINLLSQNLSNNITIYNQQAPDAETMKQENENIDISKPDVKQETTNLQDEFKFKDTNDEWIWISNLLKVRVQIEKELRISLSKMISVVNKSDLTGIEYNSLTKLFDLYCDKYPDAEPFYRSMRLFSSVANAAIHGQTISKAQYTQAIGLGTRILGFINMQQKKN